MSNSHPVPGPQIPAQGFLPPQGRALLAATPKRPRSKKSSLGAEAKSDKRPRSGKSDSSLALGEDSSPSFACPFYKWDPAIYGGEGGCSSWANKNLESLFRYHILDKHRKANQVRMASGENHCLDDAKFEEVEKLKGIKSPGESKEEQAENKWKGLYNLLFDTGAKAKADVPDPYFEPERKTNALGFSLDDLRRMIGDRLADGPSIIHESVGFIQEIAQLESEQARQKEKLHMAATERESQLNLQMREIKVLHEQKIEAYYKDRISRVRSRYMAIVSQGPELVLQPFEDPPPLPSFDFDVEFELEFPIAVHPPQPSTGSSVITRPRMFEQSKADTAEQSYSTTSSWTSLPQQSSGNSAYDLDQCGICPTTISDESMWCEGCRHLKH